MVNLQANYLEILIATGTFACITIVLLAIRHFVLISKNLRESEIRRQKEYLFAKDNLLQVALDLTENSNDISRDISNTFMDYFLEMESLSELMPMASDKKEKYNQILYGVREKNMEIIERNNRVQFIRLYARSPLVVALSAFKTLQSKGRLIVHFKLDIGATPFSLLPGHQGIFLAILFELITTVYIETHSYEVELSITVDKDKIKVRLNDPGTAKTTPVYKNVKNMLSLVDDTSVFHTNKFFECEMGLVGKVIRKTAS